MTRIDVRGPLADLSVPEGTLVGRPVGGSVAALTPVEAGLFSPSVIYMPTAGQYVSTSSSTASMQQAEALELAMFFVAGHTRAIDRLACYVVTGGSAGATIRLGLRAWNPSTMRPGAVLLDSGALAAESSATVVEATVAYTLVAGTPYALTFASQGTPSTRPSVPCITSAPGVSLGKSAPSAAGYADQCYAAGQSGAFASAPTWTVSAAAPTKVWVRTA